MYKWTLFTVNKSSVPEDHLDLLAVLQALPVEGEVLCEERAPVAGEVGQPFAQGGLLGAGLAVVTHPTVAHSAHPVGGGILSSISSSGGRDSEINNRLKRYRCTVSWEKWYTHKTSGFKTSSFKTSGVKTSGLQNVRFTKRQVSKRLVSKRPVFKFDMLINQKVLELPSLDSYLK